MQQISKSHAGDMDTGQPFTVDRMAVGKHILLRPSASWPVWMVLCAGILISVAGCVSDVRLLMVGLMLCVAVAPAVAVFIYFSHTLSPDMVANLLPHTLERRPDGYMLRLWRRPDTDDDSEGSPDWMETGSIMLYDRDIIASKSSFDYEMLFFKDSLMKILYVPRF